jgi:MFS family permease
MTRSFPSREGISFASWRVLALLGFAIFINFVDRGNLSIAAPLLKDELHLSASQLGILLSSFFWTYALCAIPAGALVDRFDPGWTLALGFLLWSCATSATGLVHSFAVLLSLRLILGMAEAVAFPAYATILARHFREDQRGLANSVGSVAQATGPAAATFAGGLLIARLGWRPFFVLLGLTSLLWLIPWLRWMPRSESSVSAASKIAYEGIVKVLRQPSVWGMCGGLFCGLPAAHMAAVLSRSRAAFFVDSNGKNRRSRILVQSSCRVCVRLAFGHLDCRRCNTHLGA